MKASEPLDSSVPALRVARQRDDGARLVLWCQGEPVGSVARSALPALGALSDSVQLRDDDLHWIARPAALDSALAAANTELRRAGLIRAWRDEPFAVFGLASGRALARIERAAARFWGTLTLGAHCTGWVAGAGGAPERLWIARRALSKATDPGMRDNLIGGGVPAGQTPLEAVVREGFEEAGLDELTMAAVRAGSVFRLHCEIEEGRQLEDLHCFDLQLPAGRVPLNQDGEVADFEPVPIAAALHLALGKTMTTDAALVTLDFLARHGLLERAGLTAAQARRIESELAALHPGASDPFVATLTFSEGLRQAR